MPKNKFSSFLRFFLAFQAVVMILALLTAAGAYRQSGEIRTSLARVEAAVTRHESAAQAYEEATAAYISEKDSGATAPNRAAMEAAYAAATVAWHELWERRRDANATVYGLPVYPLSDSTSEIAMVADGQVQLSRQSATIGFGLLGGLVGQLLFLYWLSRRKSEPNTAP